MIESITKKPIGGEGGELRSETAIPNLISDEFTKKIASAITKDFSSDAFIELIEKSGSNPISINFEGKFFNVKYSGKWSHDWNLLPYAESNEYFDQHMFESTNAMREIDGLKGIAGGFTFPLSLVLNIQRNNNLKTITFVDTNQYQLFHGIFVTLKYDKFFFEGSLLSSENKISQDATPMLFLQNSERLKLKEMLITFKDGSLENELENTDEKRKYFIYPSNAFNFKTTDFDLGVHSCWSTIEETRNLLAVISRNGNIAFGSCIMPVAGYSSDFMILRKEKDGFTLPYFHLGRFNSSSNEKREIQMLFEKEFRN
jgi:hypothetical protein